MEPPLQYSCLETPMNGGAWWAAVHAVAESDTTERLHFHFSFSLFPFMHWRRKWPPTPVFLPGESQGQRSLVGCRLWGRTESDTTEATQQQQQQQESGRGESRDCLPSGSFCLEGSSYCCAFPQGLLGNFFTSLKLLFPLQLRSLSLLFQDWCLSFQSFKNLILCRMSLNFLKLRYS